MLLKSMTALTGRHHHTGPDGPAWYQLGSWADGGERAHQSHGCCNDNCGPLAGLASVADGTARKSHNSQARRATVVTKTAVITDQKSQQWPLVGDCYDISQPADAWGAPYAHLRARVRTARVRTARTQPCTRPSRAI